MAADGRGGRELLALIHQHLLRGGYARAARELQAQTGQKLLPSLSTSLEDIFTHWEKTPSNSRRRKVSDEEAAIPEKIRVPDPVSSSESSEKEEDEKEKAKAANAASLSLATNSGVNVESSEDDDSSSEEEAPAGKGAVTVTPPVVIGKAANSLHSPNKPTAPAGKAAVLSAENRTVVSNKQQPNASAASAAPTKAGQKLPSPGKPGHAATASAKVGQSKAPVMTKAPESSSSSSSSSSESEEEKEMPTAKAPAPKVEPKQAAAGATESSSEESSDETSSEEELATPGVQAKPAVKTVQVNAAPVKSAPAAPVSLKKNAVRQTALAPNRVKLTSTTVPGAAKPDDTSESSDSSDSEDGEPPSVTQTKPPPKSSQAIPSQVKPTPAASLSGKAASAKTLPLSQGKPAPKPAVPKQAKTTLGRTAAPTKPAESTKPVESSDSSGSEEEDPPLPVSQKRLTEQPAPVPNLSQAAKAGLPEKAVGSTLKSQASESGSSDSSDSEEESPVAQTQPPQAVKTNAVPQLTNMKKAPAPAPAPPPVDSSDDSSEESDSEEEIVPPSQAPTPPCLKQTVPVGKAPPANTAAPQAAPLLQSTTAKSRKPGLQPAQDARLSQAAPPTQAGETSDSSSSSDSDEEETPKQPLKPGSLQKPGGTQPARNSSSESSEEEEAASQSLLTGYLGLSRTPAAPQAPKTVPPQPVGKVGQGKAAVTAADSLTKASVKATPADSSSSDSSDSDTDIDRVAANHKAENNPPPQQEATGASNKEKVAGKMEPGHASLKPSPVKKALAVKENDVGAKGVQVTPASHTLFSTPQSEESNVGSETEVTTAAKVPAVQTLEGMEEKKKKKKEKKEKKEKKKSSSTADKAVKTSKSKDKENKKQKTSQKRKLPGEDGAAVLPKEKKQKGQANEEVPKKKKKKAAGDLEKLPGSKEKKKSAKKKKTGKEKKKSKKVSSGGEPIADGSAEVHKKKKKKKKTAEPEGL
ncbi:treacle protein isoform X4 [Ciconia boyciana]|uniref:treacle protein isoform X4 n=1 Tax=Ciconia boyciana TaxID=52775 RepID=UPI003BA019C4